MNKMKFILEKIFYDDEFLLLFLVIMQVAKKIHEFRVKNAQEFI